MQLSPLTVRLWASGGCVWELIYLITQLIGFNNLSDFLSLNLTTITFLYDHECTFKCAIIVNLLCSWQFVQCNGQQKTELDQESHR